MSKLEMAKKSIGKKLPFVKYFFMSDLFTFTDGFFAISNFASIDEITLGCFGGTRVYPTWHFGQMQGCIRSSWELRRSKLPWNCNFLRKMLTEAMPVKVMQICVYLHLLFCPRLIAECLKAGVSEEILNWLSLRAELWIIFLWLACLSQLRQ